MSMGIVDRLISFVNPVEDGDAREQAAAAGDGRQKNLVISEPHSFDEVQELADSIRMNRPVILNTSKLDRDTARRVLDFMSGCIYALDETFRRYRTGYSYSRHRSVHEDGFFETRNNVLFGVRFRVLTVFFHVK